MNLNFVSSAYYFSPVARNNDLPFALQTLLQVGKQMTILTFQMNKKMQSKSHLKLFLEELMKIMTMKFQMFSSGLTNFFNLPMIKTK